MKSTGISKLMCWGAGFRTNGAKLGLGLGLRLGLRLGLGFQLGMESILGLWFGRGRKLGFLDKRSLMAVREELTRFSEVGTLGVKKLGLGFELRLGLGLGIRLGCRVELEDGGIL